MESVGRAPFRGPRSWGLPSDPWGGGAAQRVRVPPRSSMTLLLGVRSAGEAGSPRRCRTGGWTEGSPSLLPPSCPPEPPVVGRSRAQLVKGRCHGGSQPGTAAEGVRVGEGHSTPFSTHTPLPLPWAPQQPPAFSQRRSPHPTKGTESCPATLAPFLSDGHCVHLIGHLTILSLKAEL